MKPGIFKDNEKVGGQERQGKAMRDDADSLASWHDGISVMEIAAST